MKLSRREIVLLSILFILLSVVGYFFLFYQPVNAKTLEVQASIAKKTSALDSAVLRVIQMGVLTTNRDKLIEEWQETLEKIPAAFDDAEFIELVRDIIVPYTDKINLSILQNVEEQSYTKIYYADLNFTVLYNELLSILKAFEEDEMDNRIVNISYDRTSTEDSVAYVRVNMTIELLTRSINMLNIE